MPTLEPEDERCFKITGRLLNKCRDLIVFNNETMNDKQLQLSRLEYAKVAKTLARLEFVRDLPVEQGHIITEQAAGIAGLQAIDNRVQCKAWKVKMETVNEIYGKAEFNYQLFSAALQDHLAEEKKKNEKLEKTDVERKENPLEHEEKIRPRGMTAATECACYLFALLMVVVVFLAAVKFATGGHISLYTLGLSRNGSPL